MTTKKKPTTKKTVSKVKPALKKLLTRKPRSKKAGSMKSFRVNREAQPFMIIRVTRQTVLWSILMVYIMIMQLWVLSIQLETIRITDSISAQY